MTDPRITEIAALKAIAEAAERDWDSPIPLMTLRNFHAAASPTIILTLLERLATAEKQIARAKAAITLCVPDDLTPAGERVLRATLTTNPTKERNDNE